MELPDVQSERTTIPIALKKVGVIGVKSPIGFVSFNDKPVVILPTFDVYVDLPADQKGIHASRNYEIIPEILNRHVGQTYKLENVCSIIASELLQSHSSASRSEVRARGEIILEKYAPKTGKVSYESYKLMASALGRRQNGGRIFVRKTIGLGVVGITACPCAQEMLKEYSENALAKMGHLSKSVVKKIIRELPIATHMQRSYGQVFTEVPNGFEVEASKLAKIIEESLSASTFGLLKRSDEAELILRAVNHTRFAEDCIRYMMRNFAKFFHELPDKTLTAFKLRSEESIHKHDLIAERNITLGEIRNELKDNF